jgi:hypothetical protein
LDLSSLSDLKGTAIDKLCGYFAQHPDRAEIGINKVNETLYKSADTARIFAGTLDFLNQAENREKLTNGTSACATFFNDINGVLVADVMRSISDVKNVESTAQNTFKSFGAILKSLIQ